MTILPVVKKSAPGWGPQLNTSTSRIAISASPSTPSTVADEDERRFKNMENINRYPPTRLGRACDFSESNKARMAAMNIRMAEMNRAQIKAPTTKQEDEGFTLMDTRSGIRTNKKSKAQKPAFNFQKQMATNYDYQSGILSSGGKLVSKGAKKGGGKGEPIMLSAAKGKGKGKKGKGKGKGKFGKGQQIPVYMDWSVNPRNDWEVVCEFGLNSMPKMLVDSKAVIKKEDLRWCGKLYRYDKDYDKISARKPARLPIAENVAFYNPPASEDEQLQDLMEENDDATVFATEQVLAAIMAASRSVYSWDCVITKVGGKILVDKRDQGPLDFMTVNETAESQPSLDDESLNGMYWLGREATRINQNFSQAIVDTNAPGVKEVDEQLLEEHPFAEDDAEENVAATVFRYRKVTIPGNKKADDIYAAQDLTMIVRTEVSATADPEAGQHLSAKCLNEVPVDKNVSKADGWKDMLAGGGKKGLILATEIKNNSFKFARWIGSCWLSGCDKLKLGFASRVQANDPYKHELIMVQTQDVNNLADQSSFREHNAFGIVKGIMDTIRRHKEEEAQYLLIKDPTKPVLKLYQIPPGSLDQMDDEEYEEEEEEDDDGLVE